MSFHFHELDIRKNIPSGLLEKAYKMNLSTHKPILGKLKDGIDYWTFEAFQKILFEQYPHLFVLGSSDNLSSESIVFYVASSHVTPSNGKEYVKLGFSAYDESVPREPKSIRREIHDTAYHNFIMPSLLGRLDVPYVFVELPEKGDTIQQIFYHNGFRPIKTQTDLEALGARFNISILPGTFHQTPTGQIGYRSRRKHNHGGSSIDQVCYAYQNPRKVLVFDVDNTLVEPQLNFKSTFLSSSQFDPQRYEQLGGLKALLEAQGFPALIDSYQKGEMKGLAVMHALGNMVERMGLHKYMGAHLFLSGFSKDNIDEILTRDAVLSSRPYEGTEDLVARIEGQYPGVSLAVLTHNIREEILGLPIVQRIKDGGGDIFSSRLIPREILQTSSVEELAQLSSHYFVVSKIPEVQALCERRHVNPSQIIYVCDVGSDQDVVKYIKINNGTVLYVSPNPSYDLGDGIPIFAPDYRQASSLIRHIDKLLMEKRAE